MSSSDSHNSHNGGGTLSGSRVDNVSIECVKLCKSFGERRVLHDLSFKVQAHERVAVLGSSGTGKSVLLKILLGLMEADSGSAVMHSDDRVHGVLFQGCALFDSMTVLENVLFALQHLPRSEAHMIAQDRLRAVGIDDGTFSKMPHEISGGMKKRVALARAVAHNPQILLLDEPTSGLDPVTSLHIANLIRDNVSSLISLTITHDLIVAETIASRMIVLHETQIIYDGDIDGLRKDQHPFIRNLMRATSV